MEKAIIVAYDRNRAIGQNGDMPWGRSLPADLVNFKHTTRTMGRSAGAKTQAKRATARMMGVIRDFLTEKS